MSGPFDTNQMFLAATDTSPIVETAVTGAGLFIKGSGHRGFAVRIGVGAITATTLVFSWQVLGGPTSAASDASVIAEWALAASDASTEILLPFSCDDEYVFLKGDPTGSTSDISVAWSYAGLVHADNRKGISRLVDWTTS